MPQLLLWAKLDALGPVMVMLLIVAGPKPLLVTVTVWGGLVKSGNWVPNEREVGETVIVGAPQLLGGSSKAKACAGENAPLTHIASFPPKVLASHARAFSSKLDPTEEAMLKLAVVSSACVVLSTAQT